MPISPNVAAAPLGNLLRVPRLHVDQVDVLRNLERGKDVCLLARTGFEKSLELQPLYWPRHRVLLSIKIKNLVEVASDLDRPNCYYNIFNHIGLLIRRLRRFDKYARRYTKDFDIF